MSKVLALLTLAVLAFCALTGPAFAQIFFGQIGARTLGRALRSHPPVVVNRELGRGFGLGWNRYLDRYPYDLPPSRQPGYLDNGIVGSKPHFGAPVAQFPLANSCYPASPRHYRALNQPQGFKGSVFTVRLPTGTTAGSKYSRGLAEHRLGPGDAAVRDFDREFVAKGHVWTAPGGQELFYVDAALSGAVMCPAFGCGTDGRWP